MTFKLVRDVTAAELAAITCAHPLADLGYAFDVLFSTVTTSPTRPVPASPRRARRRLQALDGPCQDARRARDRHENPFPVDDAGFYGGRSRFRPVGRGGAARVLDDNGRGVPTWRDVGR